MTELDQRAHGWVHDLVSPADAAEVLSRPVISVLPTDRQEQAPRRPDTRWWLAAGSSAATLAGLGAGVLGGLDWRISVPLVLGSLLAGARSRVALFAPGRPSPWHLVRALALVYAVVGLAAGVGWLTRPDLLAASGVLGAGALAMYATAYLHSRARAALRVVVVGDRAAISRAAMRWGETRRLQDVGGLLTHHVPDTESAPRAICGVPAACGVDEVSRWVDVWRADVVLVSPTGGVTGADVRRLSWLLEGSRARLAAVDALDGFFPHRITVSSYAGATFLNLAPSRRGPALRAAKAVLDRFVGLALLVLLAPVLGLLLLAIRLDSPGPGLFTQTRVGRNGREFRIFKLRTMFRQAERERAALLELNEGSGPLFKLRRDPRVTRVGRWLRRTSLDELPQLINVVRGEMSLVGPRPALPEEVAEYDDVERRRLTVRPGMTGLWQVSGRSNLSWESSMALDLAYTDNWRVSGDVGICLRTVQAMVRGEGAY